MKRTVSIPTLVLSLGLTTTTFAWDPGDIRRHGEENQQQFQDNWNRMQEEADRMQRFQEESQREFNDMVREQQEQQRHQELLRELRRNRDLFE